MQQCDRPQRNGFVLSAALFVTMQGGAAAAAAAAAGGGGFGPGMEVCAHRGCALAGRPMGYCRFCKGPVCIDELCTDQCCNTVSTCTAGCQHWQRMAASCGMFACVLAPLSEVCWGVWMAHHIARPVISNHFSVQYRQLCQTQI